MVLDRVFERMLATEALLAEQRSIGRKLYEELLQCPAERRHLLLANSQRFRNRMLCERLIEGSSEACFEDPRRAIEIGRLAVLAADQLTVGECGGGEELAGLRTRAWAHLGNAFRIHVDLASAETAFDRGRSAAERGARHSDREGQGALPAGLLAQGAAAVRRGRADPGPGRRDLQEAGAVEPPRPHAACRRR